MNTTYETLKVYLDKAQAFNTALSLLYWDNATLAPKEAIQNTAKMIGILSAESFGIIINDEVRELLETLESKDEFETLSDIEKSIVKHLRKSYDQLEKIPPKEYQEYTELLALADSIWQSAKENKDFNEFAPTLKSIVEYSRKFASYRRKDNEDLYDILLQDYEECFNRNSLDKFFDSIKEEIVPLLKKVVAKNHTIDKNYNYQMFDITKQKEFSHYLAEYIGFDFSKGVLAESAHPFTTNLHNHDVRITNHYHKDNLESAIFSVIHESGHGMYEMGIADEITQTLVGGGTSMGMHESQSRLYENIIGRSKEFWTPIYDKLINLFPEELKSVSLDQFIRGINKAEPGLIRTEADELSYTLHVIIRYEIEKMLLSGEIEVEELPRVWNEKYEEYLGITPANDAEGVLQDVHWSGGSFGYFPSYAIGSAMAAQIFHHMKKQMPVEEYLLQGNLTPIKEYLNEHIHQYGMMKNSNEILINLMGEELNAKYFTDYLVSKYTKLYDL